MRGGSPLAAVFSAVTFFSLLAAAAAPAAAAGDEAVRLDRTEKVEVRLVILDVVVTDREGRPVRDLTRDDFLLSVEGAPIPVDTFDVECDSAVVPAGQGPAHPAAADAAAEPLKIVLALDYEHLGSRWRPSILRAVKRTVSEAPRKDEQFMVVALTGALRVEQDFTSDREAVLRTIDRMGRDVTLWAESFTHFSDEPYLDSLVTLLDVLEGEPGSKAVVLLSNLDVLKGNLETRMMDLAARAGAARAAIHTFSARGLDTGPDLITEGSGAAGFCPG